MAIPVKAILLPHDNKYGTGLNAVRKLASQMIDITSYADSNALGDSTSAANASNIIKNNKVYRICKVFYDLDNNQRILLAMEENTNNHVID